LERETMRDDELLRRFLLGELAEDEAERLERRLLQEDALFELCEAIEGDLLAASARGDLTPAENERVLTRLAASPGGRARLDVARDLARFTEGTPTERIPPPLPFPIAAGAPTRRMVRWVAIAAGLLFAVSGAWVVTHLPEAKPPAGEVEIARGSSDRAGRVEAPVKPPPPTVVPEETPADRPAPPETAPAPAPLVAPEPAPSLPAAVFQLAIATQRGGEPAEELPRFPVPKGTRDIEIQLSLGGAEQDYASFNAWVRSFDAVEVWSRQGVELRALDWGTPLVLEIPADQLPTGRYQVEIQGVKAEGEAETIGVQGFEIVAD
jgi:hypothetical protein